MAAAAKDEGDWGVQLSPKIGDMLVNIRARNFEELGGALAVVLSEEEVKKVFEAVSRELLSVAGGTVLASPAGWEPGPTEPEGAVENLEKGGLKPRILKKVPNCPTCNGDMWDNRKGKKNPKAPDFKCKQNNGECLDKKGYPTSVWEDD